MEMYQHHLGKSPSITSQENLEHNWMIRWIQDGKPHPTRSREVAIYIDLHNSRYKSHGCRLDWTHPKRLVHVMKGTFASGGLATGRNSFSIIGAGTQGSIEMCVQLIPHIFRWISHKNHNENHETTRNHNEMESILTIRKIEEMRSNIGQLGIYMPENFGETHTWNHNLSIP